jgi:hypothetical protein
MFAIALLYLIPNKINISTQPRQALYITGEIFWRK